MSKVLSINIIGAGKVGQSLGYFLVKNNIARIQNICNKTFNSAIDAANIIGQGIPVERIHLLSSADVYLITTTDDQIVNSCKQLIKYNKLKTGDLVIHCSGALSSDCLQLAKNKGCLVASIHPAASFNQVVTDFDFYNKIYFALEGDDLLLDKIKNIFNKFKIKSITLTGDKTQYHLATVMASNFLVGLFFEAYSLLIDVAKNINNTDEAASNNFIAKELLLSLMQTTIDNLQTQSPDLALTGPIARNDQQTIKQHLETLTKLISKDKFNNLSDIYKDLSLSLLKFAPISSESISQINKLILTKN